MVSKRIRDIRNVVAEAITDTSILDVLTPTERTALVTQGVISYNLLKRRYRVTLKGRQAVERNAFDECYECGRPIVIIEQDQPSSCSCM